MKIIGTYNNIESIPLHKATSLSFSENYNLEKSAYDTALIQKIIGHHRTFLTNSFTSSFEIAARNSTLKAGDKVLCPTFTHPGSINPFINMGIEPIFIDINNHGNIDWDLVFNFPEKEYQGIIVMHYAGVSAFTNDENLLSDKPIFEDAAQAIGSYYKGKHLGTIGEYGAISFGKLKNIEVDEGGLLIVNKKEYYEDVLSFYDNGTDKELLKQGKVDKYQWVNLGGNYRLSSHLEPLLFCQLNHLDEITCKKTKIWNHYYHALEDAEKKGYLLRQTPSLDISNGHIFYILLENERIRDELQIFLSNLNIGAAFHFFPLHLSKYGNKYKFISKNDHASLFFKTQLRLPSFFEMKEEEIDYVVESIHNFFRMN